MYRIKETKITATFSEYRIQRRICFIWFTVIINPKYECSLQTARQWIAYKEVGYPVQQYYYGK